MTATRRFFRTVAAALADLGSTVTIALGPVSVTFQPRPAPAETPHTCTSTPCLRCGRIEPRNPRRSP